MNKKVKLTFSQRFRKNLWKQIYPIFPWVQRHFLKWHLVWHEKGRQPYHIGWLSPNKTLKDLEKHLRSKWGFGNHFIAWSDNGQVLSWRKLEGFYYQYHIRVFKDGEIRGHYEYTPESKPGAHFMEINEEARVKEFRKFCGNYIVQKKYISHLKPDVNISSESELAISEGSR